MLQMCAGSSIELQLELFGCLIVRREQDDDDEQIERKFKSDVAAICAANKVSHGLQLLV